ncbi:MerR family transcriptional regulator [Streptomyces olivaceiscleroticus]|uniref:MerR family transcriptional regulator n=1 Tax=Streptomyces olivaceiscleroticus TaxID=68245 RepID=A0ABN1BC78_9ACTN
MAGGGSGLKRTSRHLLAWERIERRKPTPDRNRTLRLGELAEETGLTVRTLRHYDQSGLPSPSERIYGGHRCYTGDDIRRLHRIPALRGFGLSMEQIRATLAEMPGQEPDEFLRSQLDVVSERLLQTVRLRSRLLGVLGALERRRDTSNEQFLLVIEEMTTMTPEQAAAMIEARRTLVSEHGDQALAELNQQRELVLASLTEEDRDRMIRHRGETFQLPPDVLDSAG